MGEAWNWDECRCVNASPIAVDVLGDGFDLTDAENGVNFDINGDRVPERIAWTSGSSDDAWLCLDRNGNGIIDSGKELFGNSTSQPSSIGDDKNGFLALAEFDRPEFGGNNDGSITSSDSVFRRLRLWQDENHNGISESGELKTLTNLGLGQIELKYKESKYVDDHGNQFRYRAKVKKTGGSKISRWAWDVFLLTDP